MTTKLKDNPQDVWASLLVNTKGYGRWHEDSAVLSALSQGLSQFDSGHQASVEHVDNVMRCISRGCALMKAVEEWENPFVGVSPQREQDASVSRGLQWRLVMAYNAFEIVYKSLMQGKSSSFAAKVDSFQKKCSLPVYSPALAAPNKDRAVLRHWFENSLPDAACEEDGLFNFLGLRNGDRAVFKRWLIDEQPVDAWNQSISLSKALRNMSAHGVLSANKVGELALRPAMKTLTVNLRDVTYGAVRTLSQSIV